MAHQDIVTQTSRNCYPICGVLYTSGTHLFSDHPKNHTCVVFKQGGVVSLVRGQSSSVQSLDRLGHWGDMRDNLAEILFKPFLQEALVCSSGMSRDVHSLMMSIQHFLCKPWHHPPSKVPWRIGEAGMACDMPAPCKFPSLDSCQKRFLWTHKEADVVCT